MSGGRDVPILKTDRLLLRGAEASDFEASAAMWGDPAVVKHIGGQTRDRQDAWFTLCRMRGMWDVAGYGNWVVCEKSTGKFLGEVGLANFMRGLKPDISEFPEAGWAYATHAHGKGYATEALQAVLDWSDEALQAARIVCIIDTEHVASRRVAEKCGFRFVMMTEYRGNEVQLFERQMTGQKV
ncbi:GNAT family N-acetyltransferase [Henriciella sp. AS95]|uniref:GNAT family N-acetyltransferase n=1 Tax=Henriciella sp. AS95 TaxID=3135782 RepID=UPI0031714E3A